MWIIGIVIAVLVVYFLFKLYEQHREEESKRKKREDSEKLKRKGATCGTCTERINNPYVCSFGKEYAQELGVCYHYRGLY